LCIVEGVRGTAPLTVNLGTDMIHAPCALPPVPTEWETAGPYSLSERLDPDGNQTLEHPTARSLY